MTRDVVRSKIGALCSCFFITFSVFLQALLDVAALVRSRGESIIRLSADASWQIRGHSSPAAAGRMVADPSQKPPGYVSPPCVASQCIMRQQVSRTRTPDGQPASHAVLTHPSEVGAEASTGSSGSFEWESLDICLDRIQTVLSEGGFGDMQVCGSLTAL